MYEPSELKKLLDVAKDTYQEAMNALSDKSLSEQEWQAAAQKANDAYLEFKRIDDSVTRCVIVKKLGELYGC